MKNAFVYKDFRRSCPDQRTQQIHREQLALSSVAAARKMEALARAKREAQAPYVNTLLKLLASHSDLKPAPISKPKPGDAERRLSGLRTPNPPRLRRRIFRNGSFHIVDIATDESPFVAWVGSGPPQSPTNDASAGGSLNGPDGVNLWVEAGLEEGSGGSAEAWGYVGQYFTPPS